MAFLMTAALVLSRFSHCVDTPDASLGAKRTSSGRVCAYWQSSANTPNSTSSAVPSQLGSWVCVTQKAAFSIRDTAEDVVFDGKMWLSNGYYYDNVLTRDLWCSTDEATWTLVNNATPYDGYSEMVVYDGKMWAIKGSVWCSSDGVNWAKVLERTPFGVRGYGEVVVHDGKMWQLGSGADVWYSTDGKEWMCANPAAPYGSRSACAVTVFRGKLWVMAGSSQGAGEPPEKHYPQFTTHNDVWCSADGAKWERVAEHTPWAPRMWVVSKVYAGRMWLIGGFDNVHGANLGDVWYTEDGATWREFRSEKSFSPRHEPTCYVYDNSLWVVAGNSWPLMNDVWRLTLPEARARADAPER